MEGPVHSVNVEEGLVAIAPAGFTATKQVADIVATKRQPGWRTAACDLSQVCRLQLRVKNHLLVQHAHVTPLVNDRSVGRGTDYSR